MAKQTSTGVSLSVVVGAPATEDKAGYEALSWVVVGELVDLPAYGPTVAVVESLPLATGVVEKRNGFINYGSVALGLEQDVSDAGQVILQGAIDDPTAAFKELSFKVSFTDDKVDYFQGGCFSYTTEVGAANSMIGSTAQIEINSKVLREDAPTP